jgi:hypothetical protein
LIDPVAIAGLPPRTVIISPNWAMFHTGSGDRPWRLTGTQAEFSADQTAGFLDREIESGVDPIVFTTEADWSTGRGQ